MIKGLLPILTTSAGVAVAGVTSIVVLSQQPEPVVADTPAIVEEAKTEPAPEIALLVPQTPEVEEPVREDEPAKPSPLLPAFTVLSVEPDGNGVIAGNGPPSHTLYLYDGEILIAETKLGPSGDFAIVLEKPLAPGLHQLTLRTKSPDGEERISEEAGLVNIPLPEHPKELTVLVTKAGEATRILTKPQPEPEPEAIENPNSVASLDVKTDTESVSVETVTDQPDLNLDDVKIEAVEIEGDKLFIAGTAHPGTIVNLHIGGEYLGNARTQDNGAFLFEGFKRVEPGRSEVRADMIKSGSQQVRSRAVVNLVHEPKNIVAKAFDPQKADPKPLTEQPEETVTEADNPEVENPEAVPVIRTGSSVIIRRGDSLWQVARRNYGAGVRYTTIFDANRDQVRNPNLIYPGQVLKVPESEQDSEDSSNG